MTRTLCLLGIVLCQLSTGCYPLRHGITYYPPGAINQPTGTTTRQWQQAQADKAHSDGLVLYEAAWIDGSDQLGPAAVGRLANACSADCELLNRVTLEASSDESLNSRRVQAVMDLTNKHGIALPPESIVVAHPDSNELYGQESVQIAREMMQGNRRSRNRTMFGGGTGGIFGGGLGGFPGSFMGDR